MADGQAKSLRENSTDAERFLWGALREAKRAGLHFRRQVRIGTYVADFACHHAKVVVELDGGHHAMPDAQTYDEERTAFLQRRGFRVIRFWNHEVFRDRDRVVDSIVRLAQSLRPKNASHFSTSPRGGGEDSL